MNRLFTNLCAVLLVIASASASVSCSRGDYPFLSAGKGPTPIVTKSPLGKLAESLYLYGDQPSGWGRTPQQKMLELLIIHPPEFQNWGTHANEIGNQKTGAYWLTEGKIIWKDGNDHTSTIHRLEFLVDTKNQVIDIDGQTYPLTYRPDFIVLMKMDGSKRVVPRLNTTEIAQLSKEEQELVFEVMP